MAQREQTYVLLSGALYEAQAVAFADVEYARTIQRVKLAVNGLALSGTLTIGLKLDGVDTGLRYSLTTGTAYQAFDVTGGLGLDAGVVLTAFVVAASGSDVAVWIESDVTAQAGADEGWLVLTAAALQSRIAAHEYDTITGSAIKGLQADPVPLILADITQQVRAAVRSGRKTALGAAGTIPASLKATALTLAKYELYSRVSALRSALETMRPAWERADALLKSVIKGEITPEAPADGSTPANESANAAAYGSEERIEL
jgi:hypothetical protein